MDYAKLTKVVRGLLDNTLFTSMQTPKELLYNVWMPLVFMDDDASKELVDNLGPNGFLYEDLAKAGPLGINGYPMFTSFSFLTDEEALWVTEKVEKSRLALDTVLSQ
jgi:hypothetical protein